MWAALPGVNAGSVMNGEVEHNAPAKAGFESTDAELPPGSMARPRSLLHTSPTLPAEAGFPPPPVVPRPHTSWQPS